MQVNSSGDSRRLRMKYLSIASTLFSNVNFNDNDIAMLRGPEIKQKKEKEESMNSSEVLKN